MKILLHATASDPSGHAVVSLRVDGRQIRQIEHLAPTASQAMRAALAEAIGALAVEEVRNAERVMRSAR